MRNVTLEEYFERVRGLPLPSDTQFRNFARHVSIAHSWYKHLSLTVGATFIVFLDPSAGGDFPPAQPRLHHAWQTTDRYRREFGHLAYAWRHNGDPVRPLSTDYALNARASLTGNIATLVDRRETPVLVLADEIVADCGFLLYPFVNDNEVLAWKFEQAFTDMEHGRLDHPCRELIVEFSKATRAVARAWEEIRKHCAEAGVSMASCDSLGNPIADSSDYFTAEQKFQGEQARRQGGSADSQGVDDGLTPRQRNYLLARAERHLAWNRLRSHETNKIDEALLRLRTYLIRAGLGLSSPVVPLQN
jgi:hypothetical protein